jgi:hypothetical protein
VDRTTRREGLRQNKKTDFIVQDRSSDVHNYTYIVGLRDRQDKRDQRGQKKIKYDQKDRPQCILNRA